MNAARDLFNDADIQTGETQQTILPATVFEPPKGALSVTPGATPGCYAVEISNEDYHASRNYLSHSGMIKLLRSPAHYLAYLTKDDGDSLNPYAAYHAAVLEPDRFAKEFIVYPGRRHGKAWEEFQAQHAGFTILSKSEMDTANGMCDAVKAYDEIPLWAMLRASETEKSIFWYDEELGVNLRIRADALHPHVIFDLKGIDDARPHKTIRQIVQMEYDLQAALYVRGVAAYFGRRLPFVFGFVEDKPPHGVWLQTAGQSILANGERKLRRGAAAFKRLQETGDWHSYLNASSVVELPRWATLEPDLDDDLA